jgi:hypothetical protein
MIIGLESGKHNEDLESSAKRIKESGSWKRQRVVMLIPAGVSIPTKVYLSHCSLIFPPNQGSYKMVAIGMEVGEAFSEAIEQILEHPELSTWEYILTIEHDNIPQPDALVKLLERMEQHPEFSCIGGLYWTKGEGGVPQIWGDPNDALNFRPQAPDPNGGLVECCGTGMGFNLWRMDMFKDSRLRKPFFKTLKGHEGQGVGTQDLYFWGDARKYGHRCAIDCSVKIGHYDNVNDITW